MGRRLRIDPSSRTPLPGQDALAILRRRRRDLPRGSYVELCARSHFSFLQAASSPEALVQRAVALGHDAIAITDRDGLYGIVRAHEAAKEAGLRLIVGCELSIDEGGSAPLPPGKRSSQANGSPEGKRSSPAFTLLVHVENHAGYTNLCRILTESHRRHPKSERTASRAAKKGDDDAPKNLYAGVPLAFVAAHAEGLWATLLPRAFPSTDPFADADVSLLRDAFGERFSIGLHRHLDGDDERVLRAACHASQTHHVPLVVHNGVRYALREEKPIHDVLHAIREGITLDAAGRAFAPNAEARLKSFGEMHELFPGSEHEAAFARARQIADACRFSMKELRYRFPSTGDEHPGETPDEALRRLTFEGATRRYQHGMPDKVREQVERELGIIAQLEVATYFLCVRSIVEIARAKDILCQGRGSAANSAVCYCLGITAVDPARSSLLFERFLSPERREPPDIDVDFEHERREEVIQALYEKYGRDRAAMVSEVISYRGKSALREVGKAFGFSLEQVDRLSSVVTWWDTLDEITDTRLRELGMAKDGGRVRACLAMAKAIQGFPRHLSIHVGGFVLSETPLAEIAPVEPATMEGRTVIPWDKDDIDTLGFFKVDVLGLGMLTAIRKAMELAAPYEEIFASRVTAIERLAAIPAEDPRVYDALCRADTVGVFQIESRAQMAMLPRLRPRIFYDLVIEVAIVRPGPIQGGMVHPYLRRRNGEEPIDSPHPCLDDILKRTLGVPLFQEQVMQIAIEGAGYTGGEADQLRRDMAAWRKNGRLARHEQRLHDGFAARGISREFSERLYKQIQGFGEYGFPESHAASFALLVYASSWLKVHHPAAFAAALVNSQPMGFYSPNTILEDARRHGVRVLPIDVTKSDWDCTLEAPQAIRVGLRQVKGLGEEPGRRLQSARESSPFADIGDVCRRGGLDQRERDALAEAGALRAFAPERRVAMWAARTPSQGHGRGDLFRDVSIPELPPRLPPLLRAEQLMLDFERTGISVVDHPMRVLRASLPPDVLDSRRLAEQGGQRAQQRVRVAGLVICRQRPGTASGVVFITLEDEHGFINLVLWAKTFEKLRHTATTSTLLLASGYVEATTTGNASTPVTYVIVDGLEKLAMTSALARRPPVRDPGSDVLGEETEEVGPALRMPSMSRDFH
jgi:error-prone DNA polymerase